MEKLCNLVGLRQIGIKIIFSVVIGHLCHATARCQTCKRGKAHGTLVERGERAGQPHANGTALGVRRCAEIGLASAKDLGFRCQLNVYLKADDGLVLLFHCASPPFVATS